METYLVGFADAKRRMGSDGVVERYVAAMPARGSGTEAWVLNYTFSHFTERQERSTNTLSCKQPPFSNRID